MLVENALTAFLKRKNSQILNFNQFDRIYPPKPQHGKQYLLYIHIPFCEELCPYCSFNRYAFRHDIAVDYFTSLTKEIHMYAELGFNFSAIYVGGGTPTVLPEHMGRLLLDCAELFAIKEISLETNPNHLTDEIVKILKDSGVNRLSVGVQSFDDQLLKQMDRLKKYGSGEEIKSRLWKYSGVFDTLNIDMIFNFPTQTSDMLIEDCRIIKELQADQVTFYPLMVSDITKRELERRFGVISYRQEKYFYELICSSLQSEYGHGTAWCFSRKNSMIDEYIVDYDEYIGAGSGAFGYVNGTCIANTFDLAEYSKKIQDGKLPIFAQKKFSPTEQIQYDFMMKLFGTTLDLARMEQKFGGKFSRTLWKEIPFMKLIGALKASENEKLNLTPKGRYLWVVMMREFFTGVNNFRDICRVGNRPGLDCT